jgi:TrpR family trp operon transcriptional repressor
MIERSSGYVNRIAAKKLALPRYAAILSVLTKGMTMPKEALKELSAVLADTHEPSAMRALLEALLTPRERARLALRWRLVCLLTSGVHQRTIARKLGISLCNITRGSRELKRRPVFREKVDQFVCNHLKSKPGASPRKGKKT